MEKKKPDTDVTSQDQSGYNEKNPTEPQGAFKADSMETKSTEKEKRVKGPGVKKQYGKK